MVINGNVLSNDSLSDIMDKLKKTISHALGYYMHARLMGRDGEVQLRRLKHLQAVLEERKE